MINFCFCKISQGRDLVEYATEDARQTYRLYNALYNILNERDWDTEVPSKHFFVNKKRTILNFRCFIILYFTFQGASSFKRGVVRQLRFAQAGH